jgi:hypothetical protein
MQSLNTGRGCSDSVRTPSNSSKSSNMCSDKALTMIGTVTCIPVRALTKRQAYTTKHATPSHTNAAAAANTGQTSQHLPGSKAYGPSGLSPNLIPMVSCPKVPGLHQEDWKNAATCTCPRWRGPQLNPHSARPDAGQADAAVGRRRQGLVESTSIRRRRIMPRQG